MLVFIYLKSMQPVTITVKKTTGGFRFDYAFYFCLLCLKFCILYFGFGFSHASSMIRRHPSTPSNFGSRQTDRQAERQLIAYRIWEGGGNRLIDRYVCI